MVTYRSSIPYRADLPYRYGELQTTHVTVSHPSEIIEWFGQRHVYYGDVNSYIHSTDNFIYPIVDYFKDGLVSPKIQLRLEEVEAAAKTGKFNNIKLYPTTDVYWYLVLGDQFLDIEPAEDGITINLDAGKMVRELQRLACRGKPGDSGDRGPDGPSGTPGQDELTWTPKLVDGALLLDAVIHISIDSPLSLRLSNDDEFIEILIGLNGVWSQTGINPIIDKDRSSISLSIDDDRLLAVLYRVGEPWTPGWQAKIRQVGLPGGPGSDGSAFLDIKHTTVPSVKIYTAVTRVIDIGSDIRYKRQDVREAFQVTHLRPGQTDGFFDEDTTPTDGAWAAVVPPEGEIGKWTMFGEATIVDNLDLPIWDPTLTMGGNDIPFRWFDGQGLPWELIRERVDRDVPCCAEEFFICNNPIEPVSCSTSSLSSVASVTSASSVSPSSLSSQSLSSQSSVIDVSSESSSSSSQHESSSSSSQSSSSSSKNESSSSSQNESSSSSSQSSSSSSDNESSSSSQSSSSESSSSEHETSSSSSQSSSSESSSSGSSQSSESSSSEHESSSSSQSTSSSSKSSESSSSGHESSSSSESSESSSSALGSSSSSGSSVSSSSENEESTSSASSQSDPQTVNSGSLSTDDLSSHSG